MMIATIIANLVWILNNFSSTLSGMGTVEL